MTFQEKMFLYSHYVSPSLLGIYFGFGSGVRTHRRFFLGCDYQLKDHTRPLRNTYSGSINDIVGSFSFQYCATSMMPVSNDSDAMEDGRGVYCRRTGSYQGSV